MLRYLFGLSAQSSSRCPRESEREKKREKEREREGRVSVYEEAPGLRSRPPWRCPRDPLRG
jgi:hypothetical protein